MNIISPHRDDAALSIGVTMASLMERKVPFRLVSCFTISNFAPYAETDDVGAVSSIRAQEDRQFLEALAVDDEAIDLGRVDAPLRRSEDFRQACRQGPFSREDRAETAAVAELLREAAPAGLLVLQLGLGGHIDHRIAKAAGIMAAGPNRAMAFYEELPYACWGCASEILLAVRETEKQIQTQLIPVRFSAEDFAAGKMRLIRSYSSQLSLDDMRFIADYGSLSGRGERLWVTNEFYSALRSAGLTAQILTRNRSIELVLHTSVALFRSVVFFRQRLKIDRILERIARPSKRSPFLC